MYLKQLFALFGGLQHREHNSPWFANITYQCCIWDPYLDQSTLVLVLSLVPYKTFISMYGLGLGSPGGTFSKQAQTQLPW